MKKQAFTLVELIVVITILAILSTIAFISLSGYSKEARDSKRISDTRNLLTKINVEQTKGKPLSELIINTRTESGKILGVSNSTINTFGISNFDTLKEDSKSFKDPSNKTQDYPVAYAIGGTGSGAYKFFEIATISEKENTTKIMGNYFKLEADDEESLFLTGGLAYKEGDTPIYSVDGGAIQTPVVTYSCQNSSGILLTNATIANTEGLTSNTDLQNTDSGALCYYECKLNYSGSNCTIYNPPVGVSSDGNDLIVSDGTNSIIIRDRNEGAISDIYTSITSYGNYYQWGNNRAWSSDSSISISWTNTTTSGLTDASSYSDTGYPSDRYTGATMIVDTTKYDWADPQNDNLWGNGLNTNTSRKGPCQDGYHVPSKEEWKSLITIWFKSKGQTCAPSEGGSCSWTGTATLANFQSEFKIPRAGYRTRLSTLPSNQGSYGYYWSSSPSVSTPTSSLNLSFNSSNIIPQYSYNRASGFSLRCFKN